MPLALAREHLGRVGFAFTSRDGGVSQPPFDALNLALHVGDDPTAVEENRRRLVAELDVSALVVAEQVHGRDVVEVTAPWDGPPPQADALVTRVPRLALGVLVADCTPVLVADAEAGVVGVAHAGRKGMASGVVPALLDAMRDLGARQLHARVGPSVCARCYEVPLELRDDVATQVPVAASVTRRGTPALDVAGGVLEQLRGRADVVQLPGCTAEDASLFSYRRDGRTGRFAGVAWLTA